MSSRKTALPPLLPRTAPPPTLPPGAGAVAVIVGGGPPGLADMLKPRSTAPAPLGAGALALTGADSPAVRARAGGGRTAAPDIASAAASSEAPSVLFLPTPLPPGGGKPQAAAAGGAPRNREQACEGGHGRRHSPLARSSSPAVSLLAAAEAPWRSPASDSFALRCASLLLVLVLPTRASCPAAACATHTAPHRTRQMPRAGCSGWPSCSARSAGARPLDLYARHRWRAPR
eukprot:scaffold100_cov357-Prasinococcus_capsulatus_cf.AAC.10